MRILVANNFYADYATGGEGLSAQADVTLLEDHGQEVFFYKRTNNELLKLSFWKKLLLPFELTYSHETYNNVTQLLKEFKPDILHVNNYRYIFTPSIFKAAKDCGVKTVLTLRNYRLISPCQLCCDGMVCERCIRGGAYRTLWNRCVPLEHNPVRRAFQLYIYLFVGRKLAFSHDLIDAFIALTPFAKQRFVMAGIPEKRIYVRPNFINNSTPKTENNEKKIGAVFIGRLSSEKGVEFLIDTWRSVEYPLTVIGTGPLESRLKRKAVPNVTFTGNLSSEETMDLLGRANFLIFPSVCYETFGRTIIEAFSLKVPVIASDLGPRKDLIQHGKNGLLFRTLDPEDLKKQIYKIINNPVLAEEIGAEGERTFLKNYTPEINYQRLIKVYEDVLNDKVDGIDFISK